VPIAVDEPQRPFLERLEPDVRATLLALGRQRRFPPGAVLRHEGALEAPVLLMAGGRVKVTALASSGRELLLAVEGAGAVIGEFAALEGGRAPATVSAIDVVDSLEIAPGDFGSFLAACPAAATALLGLMGERLRDADRKRLEYAALDTVGRVASRIVELSQRFGLVEPDGSVTITLALSQEELATWIGSSREATVKALGQLRGLGWVQTGRRSILVQDLEALHRRAAF